MMTDEKVSELLVGLMTAGASREGSKAVLRSALRLKQQSEEIELSCTLKEGRTALERCGVLLPDDLEEGETVGIIAAGFANGNPAVIELCPDGAVLRVRATAKEGLIPQNTAAKALEKLRAAL